MLVRPGRRLRALLTTGALTAGLIGGAVAVAPSAAAWTPLGQCSTTHKILYNINSSQVVKIPDLPYDGGYNVRCWMDYGSTGKAVETLQLALKTCYARSIAVDGSFGSATRSALRYAQGQEKITVDGLYGEEVFSNIKWPRYRPDGSRNGCARIAYV
ncbi:hypothetical protein GTW43_19395 [Streptomyces sp. SID5785]|uniref:peptidoglycan-binding domain-containing protein n=1 Tax=Streptomyces sp. SID5785 TaxID=2690309 RepID=UPI00136141A5|nr:peptidoglycan-binding domain-containing protein [Streptomyces sp. SID5785]MZD07235.1 hypothetical protein [Streptomyces sp. SID5785]